jgi:hypothetical protein
MKLQNTFLFILLLTTVLISCKKENQEDITNNCIPAGGVTYSAEVSAIMQTSCLNCHSQQLGLGGVMLHDYTNVKFYVDNGKLLGSIRHDSGFSAMPQGQAKLSLCNIELIETWITAGALNN